jgi:hypothetical protein
MDALAIFNCFEATFWMSIGAIVFRNSRFNLRRRKLGFIAAFWFVLFGISDIFEVFTGAWWRPWPLFALKAASVVALVTCGVIYRGLEGGRMKDEG